MAVSREQISPVSTYLSITKLDFLPLIVLYQCFNPLVNKLESSLIGNIKLGIVQSMQSSPLCPENPIVRIKLYMDCIVTHG